MSYYRIRLFFYCLLRTAGSRTVRLGYLLLSRRAQGGISISGVAWLMLIRIPFAIVVHGRNLFGICSRGRCLQSRPHYLQHFPEAANRKFMQKNYTQRTTPWEEDAIGNGLETVCGAGQMRRDKLRVGNERLFTLCLTPFSLAWLWLKANLGSSGSTRKDKVKVGGTHQSYSHSQFRQLNMETSSEILSRHLTSTLQLLLRIFWKVKASS